MTAADDDHLDEGAEEGDTRKVQVKLRVKPALRARLEEAAAKRGVTLNQEMNYRLDRSFLLEEELKDVDHNVEKLEKDIARMDNEMHRIKQVLVSLPGLPADLLAALEEGERDG